MTQLDFITASEQRQLHAAHRLQILVDANVSSFAGQDRIKRRAAMLKHSRATGP